MVHALAAIVFLGALVGSIALIWFMIASRLDAIVAALDPLRQPTRVLLVRPARFRSGSRRPATFNSGLLRQRSQQQRRAAA